MKIIRQETTPQVTINPEIQRRTPNFSSTRLLGS